MSASERTDLTRSEMLCLINEIIFSERDRYIITRFLLDGITYKQLIDELEQLNKDWALQERQLKRIVKKCRGKIAQYV